MSTPTIKLIHQHGSVRKYRSDPVSRERIEMIVEAGQRASTSSNLQTYSVVVTLAEEKRSRLRELCNDQKHITQAPVFLTWCADFSRLERVAAHQGYALEAGTVESFLVGSIDAAIAMQNAGLAAESLGLGFCYIGAIRNHPSEVIKLLELPELVFPVVGMTLGWPAEKPLIRPRLPVEAVLHWERYQSEDQAYLERYDQAMIDTGIYRGRQVDREDRPPEDYGWMEHSALRVRKPSRPHLRKEIISSGFELK